VTPPALVPVPDPVPLPVPDPLQPEVRWLDELGGLEEEGFAEVDRASVRVDPQRSAASLTEAGAAGLRLAEVVGGKAAGLALLLRAGLPVPDGFVAWSPEAAREGYAVLARRSGITRPLVAVRSSSPVEDGEARSAAGLLPTELGVRGADAVAAAVARIIAAEASLSADWPRCAESASSPEAIGSAEASLGASPDQHPSPARAGSCPVLVQLMVSAVAAGVSFSAHPVTGARDRIVVEAVHGLGVLLTDGQVVPEHIVVHRHTGAVLTSRLGRQRLVATVNEAGLTRVERLDPASTGAASGSSSPVLTPARLDAVVAMTLRAEQAIGTAADVEWAFDETGRLWVLQARPITTLPAG